MKNLINLLFALFGKNTKSEPIKKLIATVTERTGELVKEGTATIRIDDCSYFIQGPFLKEGHTPMNNTQGSVFQYLYSHHLIKPLGKKLIRWLKSEMNFEDAPVNEYGMCYFFRDFHSENYVSPVYLATINNGGMLMIIAIEQNGLGAKRRGLDHMTCLVKTVSDYEKKHYAGQLLLAPFGLMEDPKRVAKHLHCSKKSIYCFLLPR